MARIGNEQFPKRGILDKVDGANGYLGGYERNWTSYLDFLHIVFQIANLAPDHGVQETGHEVQMCRGFGREVHETMVRLENHAIGKQQAFEVKTTQLTPSLNVGQRGVEIDYAGRVAGIHTDYVTCNKVSHTIFPVTQYGRGAAWLVPRKRVVVRNPG